MFAVIRTGGKQYKITSGDVIAVEKLTGAVGDTITLDDVLMLGGDEPVAGTPLVDGAQVSAEIVRQGRDSKITVFKKKRRKNYRRTMGHRQHLTWLKITGLEGPQQAAGKTSTKKAASKTEKTASQTEET
ncbi:MAG: 50S ribosomal protein L21 [Parvularculales bacterium]